MNIFYKNIESRQNMIIGKKLLTNMFTTASGTSGSYWPMKLAEKTGIPVSGVAFAFQNQESSEPERKASLVLDQIRYWLKQGNTIRAEDPASDILNLKTENSIYAGLIIESRGRRLE